MSDKAGGLADLLSVPQGGGAFKGLGEKFSADLHTGTGNFSVPISLPAGRNGLQPELALAFSTGSGNGPLGLGWSIGVPGVSRLTSKGVPRYLGGASADTFVLSGAEDLVEVARTGSLADFRPRTEGLFAQITHHEGVLDHWRVRTKDGLLSIYGSDGTPRPGPGAPDGRAVVADPSDRSRIFAWRLSETRDLFGNRIVYDYLRDTDTSEGRSADQLYLQRIRYVDLDGPENEPFLVSVEFVYDGMAPAIEPESTARPRPDPFSDYRAGFEIRTRKRCRAIVVRTHPAKGRNVLVRAYELIYLDERDGPSEDLPPNGVSLLSRINVVGYDDEGVGHREMPPLDFSYSAFTPAGRRFQPLKGSHLPTSSLTNADLELVDLFGRGLPDIVELGGTVRYWRNVGGGRFDVPRSFDAVPTSWRLSDPGVQLLDANGDGRADLLVTNGQQAGYYPLDFRAQFSPRSYQSYRQAPSFNLEDAEVRLLDLTGDGVTDVLRTGTSLECYFNHPTEGWSPQRTARVPRQRSDSFPDVNFSDPRVKLADLSGDGLQDIALVRQGTIDYWPNLGWGRWASRRTMPIPQGLPLQFDPQRVILGDVDGDGLADLLYVSDREVTLWINRTGNRWSDPIVIRGTPAVNNMVSVRLTDLLGTGVAGLLWTRDAAFSGDAQHYFLDFTGGVKPYLLTGMDNNLGAITEVSYASSTASYLRDERQPGTRWRSTLPFPVQVVERVTVTDALSNGSLSTEYRYHHGYWDGAEREFRGFGMVEQLDTQVFSAYAGRGAPSSNAALKSLLTSESFSPPVLTRTWFHQGPIQPADAGHWQELDLQDEYWPSDTELLDHSQALNAFLATLRDAEAQRDALRALRGSVLRTEVYALDGSDRQERPYTVTESAYALREESAPTAGSPPRRRIFFPLATAQRSTQWERGSDPQTRFSFTEPKDYDLWGQPTRQLAVACPRGWRQPSDQPDAGYLATLTTTEFASPAEGTTFPRNRVGTTATYELLETQGLTLAALKANAVTLRALRVVAETLNYYDGDAFVGEERPGKLGPYGALVRSEALVITGDIFKRAYTENAPHYLAPGGAWPDEYPQAFRDTLPSVAGYRLEDPDPANPELRRWYASTSRSQFDFHVPGGSSPPRGVLLAQQDPLRRETRITSYLLNFLPTEVTGPTGLSTKAEYDLRLLQPWRVTDPNDNVSEVRYSPSGLVTHSFARGKSDAPDSDADNAGDKDQASVQATYALRAYFESKSQVPFKPQPVYARVVRREYHDRDIGIDLPERDKTIETREYSDGFGRVLQTRTQGESVRFGDDARFGGGVLSLDQSQGSGGAFQGTENLDTDRPNVIVSGWQVYDNKGRVVRKYEPFFDTGWEYQPVADDMLGQKVEMRYDALGRAVRTLQPDGSELLVVHGVPTRLDDPPLDPLQAVKYAPSPWQTTSYDANDNAGRTHAGQEPHNRYAHHYNTPASAEVDALGRTVRTIARHREPVDADGRLPPIEEHVTRNSYDIQGNLTGIRDALGRLAFEYVYDLAKRPLHTKSIDAGPKSAAFDAAGNAIEQRDAKGSLRLQAFDVMNRPTRLWARDDTGPKGTPPEQWPTVTLRERLHYGDDADGPADARQTNRLGRLVKHYDEAGVVEALRYDFKGQLVHSTRQMLSDDFMLIDYRRALQDGNWVLRAPRIDWAAPPANALDPAAPYVMKSAFDALGRVKWSEYPEAINERGQPERYRLRPRYNRAGALESVAMLGPLDANDVGAAKVYVERIAYNAKGQRSLIVYGNGILTRYAYEPQTFRLGRMHTQRFDAVDPPGLGYKGKDIPLQDLAYGYDLAGNILAIQDVTPGCGVANNPEALRSDSPLRLQLSKGDALIRCFEYDPLYRLTSATGREAKDLSNPLANGYNSGNHGTPNQDNAPNLTALYWEEYSYDAGGNMLALRHNGWRDGGAGWQVQWSRRFGMDGRSPSQWRLEAAAHIAGEWVNAPSNRLWQVEERSSGGHSNTLVGSQQTHFYDDCGNLVRENNDRHFEWDYAGRLKFFGNQLGIDQPTICAIYLYDASGRRMKKVTVGRNGTFSKTDFLADSYECCTDIGPSGTVIRSNSMLHVMDAQARLAGFRVGTSFSDDPAPEISTRFFVPDFAQSISIACDWHDRWLNREEFYPFGETSLGSYSRKRYRFQGRERDRESALSYHGARYASLALCKWLSVDPLAPSSSVNGYSLLANSPTNYTDPTGTDVLPGGVLLPSERATGTISGSIAESGEPGAGTALPPAEVREFETLSLTSQYERGAFSASLFNNYEYTDNTTVGDLEDRGALSTTINDLLGHPSPDQGLLDDGTSIWYEKSAELLGWLGAYVAVADLSRNLGNLSPSGGEASASAAQAAVDASEVGGAAWRPASFGCQVRKLGDMWIKRVDPEGSAFRRWWGTKAMEAQAEGLQKLGNLATGFRYERGLLLTKDVGETSSFFSGTYWRSYFEGSRRLGTYVNDIRPWNIGSNGLIFDPALDSFTKGILGTGIVVGPGVSLYAVYRWSTSRK